MAVTATFAGPAQTGTAPVHRFEMLQSTARSHQGVAQGIPDSLPVPLKLDANDFSTDVNDTANNQPIWKQADNTKLYAATTGFYLVLGGVNFASNPTGERAIWIRKQGAGVLATQQQLSVTGADSVGLQVSDLVQLNAGQYVEVIAYQTSGAPLNTSGDDRTFIAMCYLGQ